MSKLNFEYLNKDNKNLFNITLEKEALVQSKVVSLENLIKILQTLNNTVDQSDTGYLPKNLLRSITSTNYNKALYHFSSLTASPKLKIDSFNPKSYRLFNKPYFQLSTQDGYVCFDNYKILNVILYLNYNKHNIGYKVMHLNTADSLFNSTVLDDNAKAFAPIFPNHFETSICWGGTGFGSTLRQYFDNNDLNKLQEIPFVYFNSTFNNDLSGYIILRAFKCSDMLNLDNVSYYDDLSIRDKNILDNCNEIKLNINNISYDFISPIGILNFNIK